MQPGTLALVRRDNGIHILSLLVGQLPLVVRLPPPPRWDLWVGDWLRRRRGVRGCCAPLCDSEWLRKRLARFLLPPEQQPEPKEAFAAAVAGQRDSKSPAAAQRLHRPPGGGGRARGCPACGHLCPNWRGSAWMGVSLVPLLARLNLNMNWSGERLMVASVLVWLSFVILCLHSWNLFVFEM